MDIPHYNYTVCPSVKQNLIEWSRFGGTRRKRRRNEHAMADVRFYTADVHFYTPTDYVFDLNVLLSKYGLTGSNTATNIKIQFHKNLKIYGLHPETPHSIICWTLSNNDMRAFIPNEMLFSCHSLMFYLTHLAVKSPKFTINIKDGEEEQQISIILKLNFTHQNLVNWFHCYTVYLPDLSIQNIGQITFTEEDPLQAYELTFLRHTSFFVEWDGQTELWLRERTCILILKGGSTLFFLINTSIKTLEMMKELQIKNALTVAMICIKKIPGFGYTFFKIKDLPEFANNPIICNCDYYRIYPTLFQLLQAIGTYIFRMSDGHRIATIGGLTLSEFNLYNNKEVKLPVVMNDVKSLVLEPVLVPEIPNVEYHFTS